MYPINETAITFVSSLSKEDRQRYLSTVKRAIRTQRNVTITIKEKNYILRKVG